MREVALEDALFFKVTVGGVTCTFDVLELYELIAEGQKRFGVDAPRSLDILKDKMLRETGLEVLAKSQVDELARHVVAVIEEHKEAVKKKTSSIVNYADDFPSCQQDGSSGPTGESNPGSSSPSE